MSSSESSSSSSSGSSVPNTPEAPKKVTQSPSHTPETSKTACEPYLEEDKASNIPGPSKKVSKSPLSSPEVSKKVPNIPTGEHKESNAPGQSTKISKSTSGSPEASKKVLKPPTAQEDPNTSEQIEKGSQSPSDIPDASNKVFRSPAEESRKSKSELPKKLLKSPSNSYEALPKINKFPTEESKPLCYHEESKNVLASSKGSNEEQEVGKSPLDSATPSKNLTHGGSFKSSLSILLKKQKPELEKNIIYKEMIEKEEPDEREEEGEGGDGDTQRREDDEESKVEAEKDSKEQQVKDSPENMKQRVKNEGKKEKIIAKENNKVERKEKSESKTGEQEERKSGKNAKGTEKDEGKSIEEKAKITEKKKGERKEKEGGRQLERKEKTTIEEQHVKTKERENKEDIKDTGKGEQNIERESTQKEKKEVERKKKETMKETKKREEKNSRRAEEEKEKKEERKKEQPREVEEEKEKKEKEKQEESMTMGKATKEKKTQGTLYMKRKRTFNPWKEYFFILDGLLLTYYRSQQQYDHLSGMKGSLDLSLVKEVQLRKPGLMKTHHPFCLTRRNLPSIHLAAATTEDQERWMHVLQGAIQPNRLSCHNSDMMLHAASSCADSTNVCKTATLPARLKNISNSSSSVTEEDDEEDEEKEVKKEEEYELIQPKKVLKVPVAFPLARVNLAEVKLKKLEKREVKSEDDDEKNSAAAAAAHNTTEDTRETAPPGELFGVVLKKIRVPEEEEEREEEALRDTTTSTATLTTTPTTTNKRPSKQAVIPLNSGKLLVVPEVKSPKTSPSTQKRQTPERRKSPSPSLPISKSVQALTKSAEEVTATRVDVISSEPPLSSSTTTLISAAARKDKAASVKLCHAQTNEVKYSSVEAIETGMMLEVQATRKENEETENRSVTMEDDMEEMKAVRGEDVASEKSPTCKEDEVQEAEKSVQHEKKTREVAVAEGDGHHHKKNEDMATKIRPQDPLMNTEAEDAVFFNLKGKTDIQEREEKLDKNFQEIWNKKVVSEAIAEDQKCEDTIEGAATPSPETHRAPKPLTPPALSAYSQDSADSDKSSSHSSPAPPPKSSPSLMKSSSSSPNSIPSAPKALPSLPKSLPLSPETRDFEKKETEVNVQATKAKLQQKEEEMMEEDVEEEHWKARRHRANTNESTASSSTEEGEKKPGKLKSLKNKLKSGASHKEKKEEPTSPKEPKKRRGSNAFSVLLLGKKNGGKKHTEKEPSPHSSQEQVSSELLAVPHQTATMAPHHTVAVTSESPPSEVLLPPSQVLPRMDLEGTDLAPPQSAEDIRLVQVDRFLGGQPSAEDDAVTLLETPITSDDVRHDTHKQFIVSSCGDQPPSVPKKTRTRARSPYYDVPKSNKPVTDLCLMDMVNSDEEEDEISQTVDGVITDEQIEALLNAKENRQKRKQSKSRTQRLAVSDVVKGATLPAAVPLPSPEDWGPKRPSSNSISSIDSDDMLPVTNFLGAQRGSSSSGSLRGFRKSLEADGDERTSLTTSESGESLSPEAEAPVESQRRASRPNRLSLASPEFTVQEEEGLSSPEIAKARTPCQGDDDESKRKEKNGDVTKVKSEAGTEAEAEAEAKVDSEAEQEDFFPVVGRDVQLRQPTVHLATALDLPKDELRNSGIVSLKEYLRAQEGEEELDGVKSGISRLGHSAAVEKLKQTSSEQ